MFDPVGHGLVLAGAVGAALVGLLVFAAAAFGWRVPGPLWLGGLAVTLLPNQLLAASKASAAASSVPVRGEAPPSAVGWELAGRVLQHDLFGLVLGLGVLGSAMVALAVVQHVALGVEKRWTVSQGAMSAFVLVLGAVLVLGFGLAGGAGLGAVAIAGWLLFSALTLGVGCLRIERDARVHAGRVLLAFAMIAGTVVVSVAAHHAIEASLLRTMATLPGPEARYAQLQATEGLSTLTRCGIVGLMMAFVGAGAGTGGSLHLASDPRGTLGGALLLAGLVAFGLVEAWMATALAVLIG